MDPAIGSGSQMFGLGSDSSGDDEARCGKCQEIVPDEAERCPYCGYEPTTPEYKKINSRVRNMWVLTILSLGLLSPITIPVMAHGMRKASKMQKTDPTIPT